jgi:phospholipid-transporting ATPase
MERGRPAGGHSQLDSQQNELVDLERTSPAYNTGQRPPVDDNQLLQRYDIDDSDQTQARPSVSYDEFVGGSGPPQNTNPQVTGAAHTASGSSRPYLDPGARTYSQTSALHNYSGYSDVDDFPDDDRSPHRYWDGGGASDENIPGGGVNVIKRGRARDRNSLLSLGGGMMGRAKNMLGMGPQYSEMDLPLTEGGPRSARTDTTGIDEGSTPHKSKFNRGNFKFGIGRRKVDPSTLGPRMIQLNNAPVNFANKWVDNHVSTAKYNVATFIPKFLYEQFSKYANLFFLFTAVLQQIPNISPTNRYTTIVPLVIVLLVSAIKELVEDFKRKSSDQSLNHSKARVLRGSNFEDTKWVNIAVGDVVRVESEEPFPADLVLLASSEPEGLCYIETANLDGETNLKIKQAIPETAHLVSPAELGRLTGRVRSEQPNSSLYTYEATLTMQAGGGEKELPLAPDQLLLRGATLRNTPWIHGVVVFTGHETKLMRNATATPIKRTNVERMLNKQILMLVAILLVLSCVSSIGDIIVRSTATTKLSYLYYDSFNAAAQFFSDIFTYWVLYSNLVPISLFVTIEMVKYCSALLINSDLDMYYAETDTPAICRTSSLVEELGQIEYIFSDKTGTLTCNMMEFRQSSIGGFQYSEIVPEDRRATDDDGNGVYDFPKLRENLRSHHTRSAIHHFLTLLATCHTVIPERKDEKAEIKYQAASPDEGALVEGAVQLGYKFVARKPRSVIIEVGGELLEYELLAVCEFNSTRKRMSTIFRCPDGKIRIYCKGADTVILERLHKDNPIVDVTLQHLEDYATEGLRTLCLAMREVPEQEFQEWQQMFEKAATTVGGNRAEELDKAAEIIEHDFYLLGATAIEDRLQDGVPETIHTLQTAGIKVWVLTGDRQETAINIGMSCKLISEDMTLLIVNEDSSTATRDNLTKKLEAVRGQAASAGESNALALIIDGKSLTYALEKEMEKLLLDLAVMCKAVICCRVSPLQKALVVKLVKRHLKALLLAIGDGANDVSMIQAAHVGVGISGVEGLQAARSADVAIGQFRYLRKLLLVHGAWSYQRISKVILYSFYKNIAMFMTQFWVRVQSIIL